MHPVPLTQKMELLDILRIEMSFYLPFLIKESTVKYIKTKEKEINHQFYERPSTLTLKPYKSTMNLENYVLK